MSGPGQERPGADPPEGGALVTWGAGVSVVAVCVDLLAAVLLGLVDAPAGTAERFTIRDLAPCVGGAAFVAFAAGALAWRATPRAFAGAALLNIAAAGGAWWLAGLLPVARPFPAVAAAGIHALAALAALGGLFAVKGAEPSRRAGWAPVAAKAGAENFESILVAIVFALVIRHFAVEAYKIPTASMSPTLLGDDGSRGPGDRVLVSKWPAILGGPGRWQIWVFRPPLDRTVNYVKRVVGLPGETVEIRDGDIYVDGKVARKPARTREEMWFPVWPRPEGPKEKSSPWAGEGFRRAGEDGYRTEASESPRLLRWTQEVFDGVPGRGGANRVGDVRLRFDVEDVAPGTEFVVRIVGRAGPCEARIPADGSRLSTATGGARGEGTPLAGGAVESLEVSFSDLLLEVRKNGGPATRVDVAEPSSGGKSERFSVSFGVEKGAATFRDVRLDRDVHYTGDNRFRVPEGCYMFLGDNSAHSQDSRMWRGFSVSEKAPGGRTWYSDARPRPGRDGRVEFRDRDGVLRSFAAGEVRVSDSTVDMAYVPVADLHGRAFAIFWPPRFFTRVPGGRVRMLP